MHLELYQFRTTSTPDLLRIVKFDECINVVKIHHIWRVGLKWKCDCPRGDFPTCRHRILRSVFEQEYMIDSGWFYNWEIAKWLPPISFITVNKGSK